MDINANVDWIGTPAPYVYKDAVTYDATAIDFSLEHDDNRYRLIILQHGEDVEYKIIQYGIKPGSQKPFPIDTGHYFKNKTIPLIEMILQDSYVQSILHKKTTSS